MFHSSESENSSDEEILSENAGSTDEDTENEGDSEAGEQEADSDQEEDSEQDTSVPALDASSTESDEDSDDDDIDASKEPTKPSPIKPTSAAEKLVKSIADKYQAQKGKRLYIRFPEKLPADKDEFEKKVKSLSELIVNTHKPRQKHARFCLVDFATTDDRDQVLKQLKKKSAETKVVVSIPRTESEDFVKTLMETKLKQIEKRREKRLLKKEAKKTVQAKTYTSTIVVLNIPKSASTAQVKELFPDAVDLQIKAAPSKFDGVAMATVTLPSAQDAKTNIRRSLTLGGNKLILRFNKNKKRKNSNQKKKPNKQAAGEQPRKGPLAPPSDSPTKKEKPNKKKKNKNKGKPAQEEQVSEEKPRHPLGKKRIANDNDAPKAPQKNKGKPTQEEHLSVEKPRHPLGKKRIANDDGEPKAAQKKPKLAPQAKQPKQQNPTNNTEVKISNKPQKKGNKQQGNKGPVSQPKQNGKQKNKKPKVTAQ